jgi:hypothetical protein
MPKITLSQLESLNACRDQRKVFKELFGNNVEITIDLAEEYFDKFDVDWAANNLLKPEYLNEYQKIKNSALDEYYKISNYAYAEYLKIVDSAYNTEYLKIRYSALHEYNNIVDSAYAEYQKNKAKVFVELYIRQETKD